MEYQINPSAWGPIFTMPTSVVDEHIKMVGRDQLKIPFMALPACVR